jgi:hypothetical protein
MKNPAEKLKIRIREKPTWPNSMGTTLTESSAQLTIDG